MDNTEIANDLTIKGSTLANSTVSPSLYNSPTSSGWVNYKYLNTKNMENINLLFEQAHWKRIEQLADYPGDSGEPAWIFIILESATQNNITVYRWIKCDDSVPPKTLWKSPITLSLDIAITDALKYVETKTMGDFLTE